MVTCRLAIASTVLNVLNVLAALAVLAVVTLGTFGCAIRTPAAERAAVLPAPKIEWPERPDDPIVLEIREGRSYVELEDLGIHGEGRLQRLLFDVDRLDAPKVEPFKVSIGTAHADLFSLRGKTSRTARENIVSHQSGDGTFDGFFLFCSATYDRIEFIGDDGGPVRLEGHLETPDLTLLFVNEPDDGPCRGTVIFLSSLTGMTDGETALMNELNSRGWTVVWCSPSLRGVRSLEPGFRSLGDGLDERATDTARQIDDDLAERAYALEAMLAYMLDARPALRARPTVAVGCSAGAVFLPTVVARMPDRVDAAVLVAGGADLFRIVTTSGAGMVRRTVRVDGKPISPRQRRLMHELVLERSSLDPIRTAAALDGIPVLCLHAMFDCVVPAATGDVLHDRLGRPERWSYPLGHVGLFLWLPTQARAIAGWIDERVPPDAP